MNEMEILKSLEKMYKEEEMDCSIEPDLKSPPFGRLFLYLGEDSLSRERILEITAQAQDLGESLKTPPQEPRFARVQFEVALPFEVKETASADTASLLAFLNRMLELPGYEFDEVNGKVYYRYVLLTEQSKLDKSLIMGITGVIRFLLELFTDSIERIAEEKNTFNELLEQMLERVEEMGKV